MKSKHFTQLAELFPFTFLLKSFFSYFSTFNYKCKCYYYDNPQGPFCRCAVKSSNMRSWLSLVTAKKYLLWKALKRAFLFVSWAQTNTSRGTIAPLKNRHAIKYYNAMRNVPTCIRNWALGCSIFPLGHHFGNTFFNKNEFVFSNHDPSFLYLSAWLLPHVVGKQLRARVLATVDFFDVTSESQELMWLDSAAQQQIGPCRLL